MSQDCFRSLRRQTARGSSKRLELQDSTRPEVIAPALRRAFFTNWADPSLDGRAARAVALGHVAQRADRLKNVRAGVLVDTTQRVSSSTLKNINEFRIRERRGDGNWGRFCMRVRDRHVPSLASTSSRFDARHVTIFF
jgi:hypothetical protein